MEIAYAAHTRTCTFLLDSEGICIDVVSLDGETRQPGATAERCIGAQYVASLDAESRGILIDMPRIGLPLVFARVDARGRVSLVRTGTLLRLEPRRASQPAMKTRPMVDAPTRRQLSPMNPVTVPPPAPIPQFDDARTCMFERDAGPQTVPGPLSLAPATERFDRYDQEGRTRRTSDVVPSYAERESIFSHERNAKDFREEPPAPYAIPLRRVR